jgi:cellulose synthase/poly-beta-1,6-N-acetylglucosamine synthase-like glycosyltransferase
VATRAVTTTSALVVMWVYAGYPLAMAALGLVRPRPRRREHLALPVSVIIAAHNEERLVGDKITNVLHSDYPGEMVQIVVASDGSCDRTVERARRAGAHVVLDLPRRGKLDALVAAVERSSGELLVFTDVDSTFESDTLRELVANFADPSVGGVSANEISTSDSGASVARGEGAYWRYEQWIKRLEDRVGSAVSASGRLYAVRRELFQPPPNSAGTDDFLISSQVVVAQRRLAFDPRTRVLVAAPDEGGVELRRKIRVANRGLRAAFSLGAYLIPTRGGLYSVQVLSHKVLRRFVPFFLVGLLVSSAQGARKDSTCRTLLAPQLAFYGLAVAGWAGSGRSWGRARALSFPYYFCLANMAAALAVLSLLRGVRFERWQPAREAGPGRSQRQAGSADA